MSFKNAASFRRSLIKTIEDMKAELKEFDRREKTVKKVSALLSKSVPNLDVFFEASGEFVLELAKVKKIKSKEDFELCVHPRLDLLGFKNISDVFQTSNTWGVFAKIAGAEVEVFVSKYAPSSYLYVGFSGKNEAGKTRETVFRKKKK